MTKELPLTATPRPAGTEIDPDKLPGGRASALADLTYEQARAALEEVVTALEATTVDLAASLALWERGNQLADIAQAYLDGATERIAAQRPDLAADNV